jgi:hypothetical protein
MKHRGVLMESFSRTRILLVNLAEDVCNLSCR